MTSFWQEDRQGHRSLSPTKRDDIDSKSSSTSVLLSALLPSLIQSRIPKLRLLRRTLSAYEATTTCHTRQNSEDHLSGNITPPPSYPQSEVEDGSSDASPYDLPSDGRRPWSSSSGSAPPSSAITWRFADPGFSHLSLAAQEAASANPSERFVRRQYVDGIACMLRGLPRDLTDDEKESIREALPTSLLTSSSSSAVELALIRPRENSAAVPVSQRSTLHQCVALMTLYLLLAVAALLPHVQLLLRRAWEYDRAHRVSDRVWAKSVEVADVMGKRTLSLAQSFCALHDGKVGDVVKETGIYLVQGLSGGVYDGLGEAIRVRAAEI